MGPAHRRAALDVRCERGREDRRSTVRFTGAREDVRAVTCFNWGNRELSLTNTVANVVSLGLHPPRAAVQNTVYSTSVDQPRRVHGTVL